MKKKIKKVTVDGDGTIVIWDGGINPYYEDDRWVWSNFGDQIYQPFEVAGNINYNGDCSKAIFEIKENLNESNI